MFISGYANTENVFHCLNMKGEFSRVLSHDLYWENRTYKLKRSTARRDVIKLNSTRRNATNTHDCDISGHRFYFDAFLTVHSNTMDAFHSNFRKLNLETAANGTEFPGKVSRNSKSC